MKMKFITVALLFCLIGVNSFADEIPPLYVLSITNKSDKREVLTLLKSNDACTYLTDYRDYDKRMKDGNQIAIPGNGETVHLWFDTHGSKGGEWINFNLVGRDNTTIDVDLDHEYVKLININGAGNYTHCFSDHNRDKDPYQQAKCGIHIDDEGLWTFCPFVD